MADDVTVTFGANIQGIADGITSIKGMLDAFTDGLQGIQSKLGDFGGALASAFAVDKLKDFAEGMGELGDKTATAAAILGISTEDVGALGLMAQSSGLGLQDLEGAFSRLSRNLVDQSESARRALAALGLGFKDMQGQSALQQFDTLADKFAGIKDGAEKTAIAVELFGRAGAEMIPLLNQGSAGIDSWAKAANDLGVALGENVVGELEETHSAFVLMNAAIQGASIQAFLEFRNAIDGVVQIVEDLAHSFTDAMREGGMVKDGMDAIGFAARGLVSALAIAIAAFKDMWSAATDTVDSVALVFIHLGETIGDIFKGLASGAAQFFTGFAEAGREAASAVGQSFADLGSVISDAVHGNMSGAGAAFAQLKSDAANAGAAIGDSLKTATSGFDFSGAEGQWGTFLADLRARAQSYSGEMRSTTQTMMNELISIWQTGGEKIAAIQQRTATMAPAGDSKAAQEALDAQITAMDAEADHYKSIEQQKQALIEEEVKTKQLSAQQGLQATLDALQDELQDTMDVYRQEEALLAGQPQKLAEVLKKEQAAQDEYTKAVQAAQIKAAEATQQAWQKAFGEINSSVESQIGPLLKGTETWAQAGEKALASLTTDLIKFFATWALQSAENTALQILGINKVTTAQVTGSAAQTAAQQTSSAAGLASSAGTMISQILASAKEAFAGVFGFLAPIMGPAAAVPAAAAEGTVAAAASFAVGSWELPSDMMAQVHQGEMIVPAAATPWAQSLLSNAAGHGGDTQHHHHNWNVAVNGARDPSAIVDEIQDRIKQIGKAFARSSGTRTPRFT